MIGAAPASSPITGRKRRHNEDAYVFEPPLFAVADGMGGAAGGRGRLAARGGRSRRERRRRAGGEERVAALIQEANRRVYDRANEDAQASGMGTTITVALVEDASSRSATSATRAPT